MPEVRFLTKRVVAAFSALAVLGGCAHLAPVSHDVAQWSQFRLNAANNVVLPGSLRTTWSVDSGGPISASPSVVGDTLFIGNNLGRMLAIDVRDGHEIWRDGFESALMSAPLVIGRNVVVGEGDENSMVMHGVVHVGGPTNALISLDRETGAVRWNVPVNGTCMPTGAYVDGRIVEHIGTGDLVSLSPDTGEVAFTHNLGTIPSMVAVLPLGHDTIVSAGETDTGVVAVHASSGASIWRHSFADGSAFGDGPLASDGKRVFGGYLYPVPGQAHTYVKAGEIGEQRAYALDVRTGAALWNVHLENGRIPFRNQAAIPLVDRGTLFLGSSLAPAMHAIDLKTGRMLWRKKVRGPVKGGIVATDGNIYFGDFSGRIWALRESDGSVVGTVNAGTPFNVASPIVVGRTLVVSSLTGRILALPIEAIDEARDVAASQAAAKRWFAPDILARFRTGDRNHDGVLDRSELEHLIAHANFARMDRDRNGKITPPEFGMAIAAETVEFGNMTQPGVLASRH
jgi:outer membrane protein assembly factor BamB